MPPPPLSRIPLTQTTRDTLLLLFVGYFLVGLYLTNFLFASSSGLIWLFLILLATILYPMADAIWNGQERIFGINRDTLVSSLAIGFLGGIIYLIVVRGLPLFAIGAPASMFYFPFPIDSKFVSVVILAPLVEEPLFRGAGYTAAYNAAWGRSKDHARAVIFGALVVSVIFAFYHIATYNAPVESLFATGALSFGEGAAAVSGSLFGAAIFSVVAILINERTESIVPGIIMHSMLNASLFFSGVV